MLIGKDIYSQLFFYGNCIIQCTYLHNLWQYFSNLKLASNLVLGLYTIRHLLLLEHEKTEMIFFFAQLKIVQKLW